MKLKKNESEKNSRSSGEAPHLSKKRVTLDFETRSRSDLRKEGAYKYSLDPSTQPTCLAVKVHGPENTVVFLDFKTINRNWTDLTPEFRNWWKYLIREKYEFSAHNAFFERCIYTNILMQRYGWPRIPPRLWRCTAAKAAACALPRNLQGAGEALRLPVQKDRRGYVAMMATCKPTRQWKAWYELQGKIKSGAKITERSRVKAREPEPKLFLEPDDAPDVWRTLYEYCKIDVLAEETLDDALPDLIPSEQEIWHLNQELNWRGLRVDIPTVKKVVDIMAIESKVKLKELDTLTMGLVTKPGARKSILDFLALDGIELPDLRAKTVEDKLQGFDLTGDMRRLLEIRKALSMTSTRKYQSFLNRASSDHRIRDILMYHGASTGRDTGTGVQPHNFPKGLIKADPARPYAAVENVVECDHETLKMLYGDSLAVLFSSILRSMIIPSEGYELFVADYSTIEVAVCWWLADNFPGLKLIREGKDLYLAQAAANTGRPYESFTPESKERDLGKAQTLGCQFGMGGDKFQDAAWTMHRLKLTSEQSHQAVKNYRLTNPTVPALWKTYENAAISVIENPEARIKAGKCVFFMKDKFLVIELPSGRCLRYREPQISWRETDYGPRKTIEFWAVNSKTKKWALERTWGGVFCENITQAVARDIMMPAMLRARDANYRPLLMVHDEAVCERKIGEGSVSQFVDILCEIPRWAKGCPIRAKGWKGPRYRK